MFIHFHNTLIFAENAMEWFLKYVIWRILMKPCEGPELFQVTDDLESSMYLIQVGFKNGSINKIIWSESFIVSMSVSCKNPYVSVKGLMRKFYKTANKQGIYLRHPQDTKNGTTFAMKVFLWE